VVSGWAPHFGEEPVLSGTHLAKGEARGTGNVFFGRCNLRCVYCQNWQISQGAVADSQETTPERLAAILLELQAQGCHSLGFVSPTHFVPQIVRAIDLAAPRGLRLPLVYNTNAYDNVDVLRLVEDVFDIYLPDLRYSDDETAKECSGARDYVGHARASVAEMHRQLGHDLVVDGRGLLRRGLIVRLLVLPNDLAGLRGSLEWLAGALSPRVAISVMTQYYPAHLANSGRFPLLERRITPSEYDRILGWMEELGFETGWVQPLEAGAADHYRPDFSNPDLPFADARNYLP
jgi:putative pyruvate formate lyase activating enzyme